MKRIILLLITLISLTNLSYASFPINNNINKEIVCEKTTQNSFIHLNNKIYNSVLTLICAFIAVLILLFIPDIIVEDPWIFITPVLLTLIFGLNGLKDKPNRRMSIIGLTLVTGVIIGGLILVQQFAGAFGG